MATTGRFPSTARPTFMRTSRTFNIGFGNSWEALWKYLSWRQELCGDYEHRWTLQQLPLQICWLGLRIKRLTVGGRATKVITKSISQYLVSDKSWKSKLLTVGRQLKLDCGEWRNNHRRRTLKEHVVIGTWPKKITRWKELACEQHGQSFAHASRQTGEDVVPNCLSSWSTDVPMMSACNYHIFNAILTASKSLRQHTWKSCKSGGRAGWLCCKRL